MTWVDELIKDEGVEISLVRQSSGTFDPVTGKTTGSVDTVSKTYGVSTRDRSALAKAANGITLNTRTFIVGTDVEPVIGDLFKIGSETYTVNEVFAQHEKDQVIYYTVGVVR